MTIAIFQFRLIFVKICDFKAIPFSGHKTLQMVERYSHQNGSHIQPAMDKLEQRYKTSL